MENVAKMTDASSFSFSRLCAVYIPWFKGDIKNSSKIKIDSLCVSIYFPHAFISHSHNALAVQDVFFFIFIFFPLSRCEQNDWNKKHLSIRTISRREKKLNGKTYSTSASISTSSILFRCGRVYRRDVGMRIERHVA